MIPERARRLADFLYDATVLARERGLSYFEGRVAMLAAAELMAVAPHVTGIGEEKYDALALAIIERAARNLKHFPRIVCLCGSPRHAAEMQQAYFLETMAGKIVLAPVCQPLDITRDAVITLEELQQRKIELADEVLVVDAGGDLGDSTIREVEHAVKLGKPVRYWSRGEVGHCATAPRQAAALACGAGGVQ
jgi:hypothetical protein